MPELKSRFKKRYEVSDKRLEICAKCEHIDEKHMRCKLCGCFMKFKTLMLSEECPIGKWKSEKKE